MSRFLSLTHRPHLPDDPYEADRLLPAFVKNSPFQFWQPGDPVPQRGVFVLLGVATWSGYDMQLLDILEEAMATPGDYPTVAVFNAGILTSMEAFYDYIPGVPDVFHTPAVGVWHDGVLTENAEGYLARDLVARMFGSTSDAVVAALDRAQAARAS
jgi:hypothetical protein